MQVIMYMHACAFIYLFIYLQNKQVNFLGKKSIHLYFRKYPKVFYVLTMSYKLLNLVYRTMLYLCRISSYLWYASCNK